jgi:hypothetical protein
VLDLPDEIIHVLRFRLRSTDGRILREHTANQDDPMRSSMASRTPSAGSVFCGVCSMAANWCSRTRQIYTNEGIYPNTLPSTRSHAREPRTLPSKPSWQIVLHVRCFGIPMRFLQRQLQHKKKAISTKGRTTTCTEAKCSRKKWQDSPSNEWLAKSFQSGFLHRFRIRRFLTFTVNWGYLRATLLVNDLLINFDTSQNQWLLVNTNDCS